MKLYEAMQEVLKDGNLMPAERLAEEINRKGLFRKRNGGPVKS